MPTFTLVPAFGTCVLAIEDAVVAITGTPRNTVRGLHESVLFARLETATSLAPVTLTTTLALIEHDQIVDGRTVVDWAASVVAGTDLATRCLTEGKPPRDRREALAIAWARQDMTRLGIDVPAPATAQARQRQRALAMVVHGD